MKKVFSIHWQSVEKACYSVVQVIKQLKLGTSEAENVRIHFMDTQVLSILKCLVEKVN